MAVKAQLMEKPKGREMTAGETALDFAAQFATLPWRIGRSGAPEILLVTSRTSRHWLLPKGWLVRGKSAMESAEIEAFEEAGVQGKMRNKPIGVFAYNKILKTGETLPCRVTVFSLKVKKLLDDWPEAGQREREWFDIPAAADAVYEPQLRDFLLGLSRLGPIALLR
ncbi:NUDIX hydrolase [Devosia sp. LC5]|uniref:NUDIX hydrolase n=1 Tax=Devosia sp. LC5 TaxID=1502724 RepID=UPI0004E331A3|nr:NUDIX hydrolase [Devosia sp. LC5]KFC69701.1 NUDIX hydrolase [Devosia sp. LC5]